jgi:hypothetical protein
MFQLDAMNWALAIKKNRDQLLLIVAELFALLALDAEGRRDVATPLSAVRYWLALSVLRPAESAVRRLIVVAAHGLVLPPSQPRHTQDVKPQRREMVRKIRRRISFRLFDPRKQFAEFRSARKMAVHARIWTIDAPDPRVPFLRPPPESVVIPEPQPINAGALCRRLVAIKFALDDLPRQARRYARWQSTPHDTRRPKYFSALRPGKPPGYRQRGRREIDRILAECHWLVRALPEPNTS